MSTGRSLRDQLLDAFTELLTERGYRGVRMQDVADAVGVSRQTVYNEFGDKWRLAQALVIRDNEAYLDGIDQVLARHTDLYSAVEAAVSFTLRTSADDPVKKAVLTGTGGEELLPLLTTRAEPVLFGAKSRLIEHVLRRWPHLDPDALTEVADAAIRLTMSHLLLPADPPDRVARRIARLVARHLGEPCPAGPDRTAEVCQ
ncbi:TetR family transcriptional regulator [Thermomonospora cellulosilytica]|uniref:AcrR family transcriptional regulator n=1 Tax=Thermomonospora cellulosilytica TaxID=1411118 RepID=A0A7W3N108_9ACTN|nr:TetR family transcriptional regulator [Thermomonospora cellulosilytica]MBA9005560.1 AcrR family transcriptional regulator [Thermomonospora cellulosilytica]